MQRPGRRDFEWALGINRLGGRFLGIWPSSPSTTGTGTSLRVPGIVALVLLGVLLPQAWGLALVARQLPLVVENLLTSCPALASCFKLCFLWRSRAALRPVLESAERDWAPRGEEDRAAAGWQLRIMRERAARARLVTVADHAVTLLSYLGFVLLPLAHFELRSLNNVTDHGPRHLLLQSYYPFDYSRSPYFELAQASQHAAGFLVTACSTVPENLFGALVFHSSAQFEILGLQFRRLFDDKPARPGPPRRKLKALVRRHVHLMSVVSAIEASFTYAILAQVVCTSVMICSAGFQTIGMLGGRYDEPSPFQVVTLLGIILTMMMHTLLECYASETLASKSREVSTCVYNCRWYAVSNEPIVQDLIPVLRISQIPRQLTAGKILTLSLPAFCTILKTTAGYISMLVAVTKR